MKTKLILKHLQEFGNITTWEAIQEYGCTRLSAVIFNLRHRYNLDITDEIIEVPDRYGQNCQFKRYILKKEA